MMDFVLIPVTALLNRVRGGGGDVPACRILASLTLGAVYALLFSSVINGTAVALGYYVWALPGWGLYFACVTGKWRKAETEISFIDRIGLWLVPFITSQKNWSNYRRGVLCMGLRGGIFSLPLFAGLAYLVTPWALAVWPLFFLQGVVYFLSGKLTDKCPITLAELMWGACIGAMLVMVGA